MSDPCGNYLGEVVVASFDDVLSASTPPTDVSADFKPFGLTNSKNLSSSVNEVDVTTDTTGAISAVLATGYSFEFTVSGFAADADVAGSIQQAYLKNFYHTKLNAGDQPKLWIEIVTPAETIYAYCLITGYNTAGGSKEAQTLEFSMKAVATCDPANASVQYAINP